ncbi:MAG: hypothetical protein AAF441_03905 [Pseudomonadota bacterium]
MIENIQNTPSPASDVLTLEGRFHYWEGQSGARYIFSVYKAGTCPPLPGAIYVIAKRGHDDSRYPLAIGRFPAIWESASRQASKLLKVVGGDEVHVHLLADDDGAAEDIVSDLKPALGPAARIRELAQPLEPRSGTQQGFAEGQNGLFAFDQAA